jgi:predicted transcriptional regulator of viral defense system
MKDLKILEQIIIDQGRIVTHSTVSKYLKKYSDVNKKISSLISKGLLVNLRRGVYYISKLGSLGYTSISSYLLANSIGKKSFVSFETALKYHNLFDQGLKRYRSISQKQYLEKELENITYEFIKVKDDRYFGFQSEKVAGGSAIIAEKERALIDLIEYQRTIGSVSLVFEKLSNYTQEIDYNKLGNYLKQFSQITIKTFGLFLDNIQKDTSELEKMINQKSTSRLFTSSKEFNNKWRLYYDSVILKNA